MQQKTSQRALSIILVLFVSWVVVANFLSSCMPPQPKEEAISPERQKAIRDSLHKVWEYELLKQMSTGTEYHKNKIWRRAIKPFWKVAELDTAKRFPTLYTKLAECYLNLDPPVPDSAEVVYRAGIKVYPDQPHLHRSLAWLLTGKGEVEEAIAEYQKAVELDPEYADDYLRLGNLLIKNDQPEDAIPIFEKRVQMVPDDNESLKVLSQLYGVVGDESARVEALENTLKQDPTNSEIMFNLGQIYFKQNEFAKAVEKFDMYLAIKPDDVYALEFFGNAQQNLGKFQQAIRTYEKIVAIDAQQKKIFCEMATCYKELNKFSIARNYADKALKIDSNYGLAYIVRGEIYEACADACAKGRQLKFDDKLVYELAYKEYQKAKKEPGYAGLASRRMEYVQPSMPTKGDRFMHQGQTKSKLDCHKWIY